MWELKLLQSIAAVPLVLAPEVDLDAVHVLAVLGPGRDPLDDGDLRAVLESHAYACTGERAAVAAAAPAAAPGFRRGT